MDKPIKKQLISLIIIFLIILAVILSFVLYNHWPKLTGKKIVLATQPVDPFDPFRGQYMRINYEISRLNDVSGFENKDTIYVLLEEDEEGVWRLKDTLTTKPDRGDFIKGKVTSASGNNVRVEYGIEQFFFERHAKVPTSDITVEVSVANSGRAAFIQLLQNGEPIEIEYEDVGFTS